MYALRGSRKRMVISVVAGLIGLATIGGGAYAALGGATRGSQATDINLSKGLVGWWKLDGNGKDSSPNRRNGTVTGTANVADRKATAASALSFNGSSDSISIANFDSGVLTSSSFGGNWSLSIWAKSGGANAGERVMLGKAGCNGGIETDGSGGYIFIMFNSACNSTAVVVATPADPTAWHLLTATYNAGAMAFYMDGQLVGSTTAASISAYSNTLGIGSAANGYYYFNGSLDDARAYTRTLSAAEAKALYDQYDPGLKAATGLNSLLGQWKFDGSHKDSTPNRNNGTVSGTSFTTDRKGKANSALALNGTSDYVYGRIGSGAWFGGNNSLTAMAWVYVTASSSGPIFGVTANPPGNGWNMPFLSLNGTTIYGWIYNNTPISTTVAANQWHHVSVTYGVGGSPSTILYVDGQQVGTATGSYSASGGTDYFTTYLSGVKPAGGVANFLNTPISDVRAYNRTLTAVEIARIADSYNSQVSVSSLQKGLVGDWALNGNVKDSSPSRNNGTLVNAPTLTTDRKGANNAAYAFNGTNQSVTLTGNMFTKSDFTISAWVLPSTITDPTYHAIIGTQGSTHRSPGFYLAPNGGLHYDSYDLAGTTRYNDLYSNFFTSTTAWVHVVWVKSGSTYTFYRNGTVYNTATAPAGLVWDNPTYEIGHIDNNMAGSIDDVRVYNRALSVAEIAQLSQGYR